MSKKLVYEIQAKTGEMEKKLDNLEKQIKDTKKQTDDLNTSATDATASFGAFGVTVGGLKSTFTGVMATAKSMFSSIKIGLISTGIGAFVVILGTMAQYFRDNEEGASKFREITSQIGVVIGNVTDIISDFGGALIKLFSRDLKGFKDGIKDAVDGVKNFGKTTKEEMTQAQELEKDRFNLIKLEREALVSKAKTESEIMKLRLQARDEEAFTNAERLEFMRQANQLADEQLEKDLFIAQEKLRFQQIENSYSKSSQENLDAEAQLEAEVFRIQRANFSERKRMKSEEQALAKRDKAEKEKEEKDRQTREELLKTARELELENLEEFTNAELKILIKKQQEANKIEEKQAEEARKIKEKEAKEKLAIAKAEAEAEKKLKIDTAKSILTSAGQLAGEGTKLGKATAMAQILIDTAQGISSAIAGATKSGSATGPAAVVVTPLLIAQMVGQVMAGIVSAKNILKKVPGPDSSVSTPSVGGSGGGGGGIAPTFNPSALIPQTQDLAPEPVQAYVVENDISNSQALQEELEFQTTL